MIALLNLSILGFSFVLIHDKAKRPQQGNLLLMTKAETALTKRSTYSQSLYSVRGRILNGCWQNRCQVIAVACWQMDDFVTDAKSNWQILGR